MNIKNLSAMVELCEKESQNDSDNSAYMDAMVALGGAHAEIAQVLAQHATLLSLLETLLPMAENMYLHGQSTMGQADKLNRSMALRRVEETLITIKGE